MLDAKRLQLPSAPEAGVRRSSTLIGRLVEPAYLEGVSEESKILGAKTDLALSGVDPETIIPESMKVAFEESPEGVPVANYFEHFGGFQGTVIDPRGDKHSVSLEKWWDVDRRKTRVSLKFYFRVRKES